MPGMWMSVITTSNEPRRRPTSAQRIAAGHRFETLDLEQAAQDLQDDRLVVDARTRGGRCPIGKDEGPRSCGSLG